MKDRAGWATTQPLVTLFWSCTVVSVRAQHWAVLAHNPTMSDAGPLSLCHVAKADLAHFNASVLHHVLRTASHVSPPPEADNAPRLLTNFAHSTQSPATRARHIPFCPPASTQPSTTWRRSRQRQRKIRGDRSELLAKHCLFLYNLPFPGSRCPHRQLSNTCHMSLHLHRLVAANGQRRCQRPADSIAATGQRPTAVRGQQCCGPLRPTRRPAADAACRRWIRRRPGAPCHRRRRARHAPRCLGQRPLQ